MNVSEVVRRPWHHKTGMVNLGHSRYSGTTVPINPRQHGQWIQMGRNPTGHWVLQMAVRKNYPSPINLHNWDHDALQAQNTSNASERWPSAWLRLTCWGFQLQHIPSQCLGILVTLLDLVLPVSKLASKVVFSQKKSDAKIVFTTRTNKTESNIKPSDILKSFWNRTDAVNKCSAF